MIRVLQCVNDMHRAGLETMLMNYYRNIDRDKIQFDFLTHRPHRSDYDDEIESLGGKVFYAPRLYPKNYPAYFKYMELFYREHPEYKIVHSHIDSMSYLPLLAAKKAGVPVRIAHSHNTAIDKDFKYILKQYFRWNINSVCTNRLACGQEAGKFLFGDGKEFKVIPNAIDPEKFLFNEQIRKAKRKELGLEDKYIIGHVGRISYQKNHKFLIEIFNEVSKLDNDAVLLLIGVGEKEAEVRQQVKLLGLEDKVQFLGNRGDVNELYQAMDLFILPSLFEGIPVVGVEAQFAGLPVIFSDKVPIEVKLSEKTQFIPLSTDKTIWAKTILMQKQELLARDNLLNNEFDIKVSHQILEDYYLELNKTL